MTQSNTHEMNAGKKSVFKQLTVQIGKASSLVQDLITTTFGAETSNSIRRKAALVHFDR